MTNSCLKIGSSGSAVVPESIILYCSPPERKDKSPPRRGVGSAEIAANSALIVISLGLVEKSILIPLPGTSCLNARPDSVLLTVTTGVPPVVGSF